LNRNLAAAGALSPWQPQQRFCLIRKIGGSRSMLQLARHNSDENSIAPLIVQLRLAIPPLCRWAHLNRNHQRRAL